MTRAEVDRLLGAVRRGVDAFDLPLFDQLAIVEACELFIAPHTGFGMAALAVETPWLALSGNRWPEYFYNHVPFYLVLPDSDRSPCYHQLEPGPPLLVDRDGEGPRSPSMCADRIDDDHVAVPAPPAVSVPRPAAGTAAPPPHRQPSR